MTENEVLHILSAVPDGLPIRLDHDDLTDPVTREIVCRAIGQGWLELGTLIETRMASWFDAQITPRGRAAIAALDGGDHES